MLPPGKYEVVSSLEQNISKNKHFIIILMIPLKHKHTHYSNLIHFSNKRQGKKFLTWYEFFLIMFIGRVSGDHFYFIWILKSVRVT